MENNGGFILPEVAYIDNPRDGFLYLAIRGIGQAFINFGAWLRAFGYVKTEIHPRAALFQAIENARIKK